MANFLSYCAYTFFGCAYLSVMECYGATPNTRCQSWSEQSYTRNCYSHDLSSDLVQNLYEAIESAEYQLAHPSEYPEHYEPSSGEKFDFIIIGAGSAGSVIANRLSEVHDWKVLLLEAGGNPTKTSEIPGLAHSLQGSSIDWKYHTDPGENNCLGMVNNSCKWPRGKVLGGSSTINANLYVRGHPKDYESWLEAGNYGWGYKDVLKFFKRSENLKAQEVKDIPNYDLYHSTGGLLSVSTYNNSELKKLLTAYESGVKELGYDVHSDCNGESQLGFTPLQGTVIDGKRCSAAKAFLSPVKYRKNLKVSKNSFVSKILIDRLTLKTYGVEFINSKGITVSVNATKEVIVSAGAINSPQLLMLSGIGPKSHLNDLGIEVLKDLNVGENLQDHMLMTGVLLSFNFSKPLKTAVENMFDYLVGGSGKFANIGFLSSTIFINAGDHDNYPEIQFHQVDIDPNREEDVQLVVMQSYNIKEEIAKSYINANKNRYLVLTMPTLLRPKSRGKIMLKSSNPKEKPKIISGYLSHKEDINIFLKGIEFIERLVKTKAMKSVDAKLHRIDIPHCSQYDFPSKLYWRCALRHLVSTTFHPTSTCKMGPASDSNTVVDPRLRVHSVKNLRVADASIMPNIISGNTNAPSIMIGERAADFIKEDWN